ncbi:MAG TPA: SCO family protein [Acidobacteriaceae bacterium]|nr:SCO family protein [Acidobacteriaceae bacterium]
MHRFICRRSLFLVSYSTILLLCGMVALQGCRNGDRGGDDRSQELSEAGAIYQIKGIVVSSDAKRGEVMIDTEAIPGFMGAMTMPYKLAQPGIATELHPGDHVMARLRVTNSTSVLDQIDVTQQAQPDYKPAKLYNVPAKGETVPNFRFLNQDGKTIDINQFRGKALLITFIYTRCPLPDYCIRMSRNFATVQHLLSANPLIYNKVHLLSVSFDPEHDTPKVLRSYGTMYTGDHGAQAFSHWDFAAPSASELDTVEEYFNVGVSPGPNNTLTHSLSTALIAPNGKIFTWYPNNDWEPSVVVDDIQRAVVQ